MSWERLGDSGAMHPIVLEVPRPAMNEVFGFVVRCSLQVAAFEGDYFVSSGVAHMMSNKDTEAEYFELCQLATDAGYWSPATSGKREGFALVEDSGFIHMISKTQKDWQAQRKADSSNPELTLPVRFRDGDACRYCAKVVFWKDRKTGRGGTYDHREPMSPATIDTYVVAHRGCNTARSNIARGGQDPDLELPLLPPPANPYYSTWTANWLNNNGYTVTSNEALRPGSPPDNATATPAVPGPREPGDSAASGTTPTHHHPRPGSPPDTATTPATPQPAEQREPGDPAVSGTTPPVRPGPTPDTAHPRSDPPADNPTTGSARAGSGRDGSGAALGSSPPTSPRKRARRGRQRGGTT